MRRVYLFTILLLILNTLNAQNRGAKPFTINVGTTQILYKESHALIIGNSEYHAGWPSLTGVANDVPEVKNALEKNGFSVITKMNLTKDELDKAFIQFITKHGQSQENRLLFYFAGHGHTLNNYGEVIGYIVPTNAQDPNVDEPNFIANSIPMSRIEEYAKQMKSKHALFVFDACFSGSLFSSNRAIPEIISYKTSQAVRQFITSGSESETVPDVSIFRQQFVEALTTNSADANKDGYLTGTELGKFLQDNVINYSKNTQHPQYGKIKNQYLDKGDFVFILDTAASEIVNHSSTKVNNDTNKGLKPIDSNSFTDKRDGRTYKTAKIAGLNWMTQNLAYKPESGLYWTLDDKSENIKYGYLYDWYTAQEVCPAGWRLPTVEEYRTVMNNAGDQTEAFKELQKRGKSDFSVIFSGYRYPSSSYGSAELYTYFWTSVQKDDEKATSFGLDKLQRKSGFSDSNIEFGFSVRCVENK